MRSCASPSKPARLTTPSRSVRGSSSVIGASVPSGAAGAWSLLAGQLEPGQRGEQRLAPDLGVPEGDGHLLVAAGQLRVDDDAVTPARVAHAVAVAVAALAGHDGTVHDGTVDDPRARSGSAGAARLRPEIVPVGVRPAGSSLVVPRLRPSPEGPGSCPAGERLAARGEVPRGPEHLPGRWRPRAAAALAKRAGAWANGPPEPGRPAPEHA